jgi:hypothetical protein
VKLLFLRGQTRIRKVQAPFFGTLLRHGGDPAPGSSRRGARMPHRVYGQPARDSTTIPSRRHGHKALDTDSTPTLEGEAWLLRNGYTQAEGVANLDEVPEKGALVAIRFPKLQGGTGGCARFIAIGPPDRKYGASVGELSERPMQMYHKPLHRDSKAGVRVRSWLCGSGIGSRIL